MVLEEKVAIMSIWFKLRWWSWGWIPLVILMCCYYLLSLSDSNWKPLTLACRYFNLISMYLTLFQGWQCNYCKHWDSRALIAWCSVFFLSFFFFLGCKTVKRKKKKKTVVWCYVHLCMLLSTNICLAKQEYKFLWYICGLHL